MCQMSIFSTVVCPSCAPGIGGTMQRGLAKKFPALRVGVCAPNFKTVSAPMAVEILIVLVIPSALADFNRLRCNVANNIVSRKLIS